MPFALFAANKSEPGQKPLRPLCGVSLERFPAPRPQNHYNSCVFNRDMVEYETEGIETGPLLSGGHRGGGVDCQTDSKYPRTTGKWQQCKIQRCFKKGTRVKNCNNVWKKCENKLIHPRCNFSLSKSLLLCFSLACD